MSGKARLEFYLRSLEDCAHLGKVLADVLLAEPNLRCVLLRGALGSGKTTLTRFTVQALPGGDKAESSSPGFTLCNRYPTQPEILHCDLYRSGTELPEELREELEADGAEKTLIITEWAEYLPAALLPEDFLDIHLELCNNYRIVGITGKGLGEQVTRIRFPAGFGVLLCDSGQ